MKSILLIGVNNFGTMLARQLHELGHQVLAVDRNEARINAVLPIVTISSNFQSSLETTSLLKELGGKLVVSRADREVQAKFLLRNGADEVINPEKQIAEWAAIRYASDHILDYIRLDESHALYELSVPREWVGKTVGQIDIRKRYGINIMAVRKDGVMNMSVVPETVLCETMTMLVLGDRRSMQKCFKF